MNNSFLETCPDEGTGSKKIKPSIPKSFQEVITLTENYREGRLTYFLVHLARVINFSAGVLTLNEGVKSETQIIRDLKVFLDEKTDIEWKIEFSQEQGNDTISCQRANEHEQQNTEIMENSTMQAIRKGFPNAKISSIKKVII